MTTLCNFLLTGWVRPSTSAVWTATAGLNVLGSEIKDGSKTVVWVSGGLLRSDYELKVVVTTNSTPIARVDSRTLTIKVRNR